MKRLLILLSAALSSCYTATPVPNGNDMPEQIRFVLLNAQGIPLLTSVSTPLVVATQTAPGTLYTLGFECQDGGCRMINEFAPTAQYPYPFFYSSLEMALFSVRGNKQWLLTLNGKTDTLYCDVQRTRPNDPLDQFDVVGVTFNGRPVSIDKTIMPWAYVLRRRH